MAIWSMDNPGGDPSRLPTLKIRRRSLRTVRRTDRMSLEEGIEFSRLEINDRNTKLRVAP